MKVESGRPWIDAGELRKQSVTDYVVRFAFGAGISAAAAIAAIVLGPRMGGVLLAFPAILPASLTLIERKTSRRQAVADATGAILGAVALVVFAIIAFWTLTRRINPIAAVALAGAAWAIWAVSLYGLVSRLRRRE